MAPGGNWAGVAKPASPCPVAAPPWRGRGAGGYWQASQASGFSSEQATASAGV